MTDRPRLIDADKLIKQLQDNRDLFAEDKLALHPTTWGV